MQWSLRDQPGENSVQILSEMAATSDGALIILLDSSEMQILRNAATDLVAAQELVSVLLSESSGT